MSDYDVIIVGAGIVGASTAYHIMKEDPKKKVLLVESLSGAGLGDTSKSTECFRNFYASQIDYDLSDSSAEFYMHLQNEEKIDIHLRKSGYLWLFNNEQYENNSKTFEKMSEMGVELKTYEENDLRKILDMNTDVSNDDEAKMMGLLNVNKGVLSVKSGYLSTLELVNFYVEGFKSLGGEVRFNTSIRRLISEPVDKIGIPEEPFLWQDIKITGIVTDGGEISADKVILSVGVWVEKYIDPLGIESYAKVVKRAHFAVKANDGPLKKLLETDSFNAGEAVPTIILPKPQILIKGDYNQHNFWVLYPHHRGVEFGAQDNPEVHEDKYNYGLSPIVTKYFPQFAGLKPSYGWACHRVIMPTKNESRIISENGLLAVTSTHGIIQGDALGRVVAAVYNGKTHTELYGGRTVEIQDFVFERGWQNSLSQDHHV